MERVVEFLEKGDQDKGIKSGHLANRYEPKLSLFSTRRVNALTLRRRQNTKTI